MKKIKLPVIAVSAVLGFVACGNESLIAPVDGGAYSPVESSSDGGFPASSSDAWNIGTLSSSSFASGIYSNKLKANACINTCTQVFVAVLFLIAKVWKPPRCPLLLSG